MAFVLLLILMPLFFGQLMFAALEKLHLGPDSAAVLMVAIVLGSFVNIPVKRLVREELVSTHPLAVLGLHRLWPQLHRVRHETTIALNLGGCIVPAGLALYELLQIVSADERALAGVGVAVVANTAACYFVARPVAGIGIVMPGFISPLVAAIAALLLTPEQAAPVAFIAGVAGPLLGADVLHLKDIRSTAVGVASIGGAGTFDGIVLSGIIAAYLA